MKKILLISTLALLAGGVTSATAASDNHGAAMTRGKCWDSASNQIKDMAASNRHEAASGQRAPGGVATGSNPSGMATETTGSANARPAGAAGLPNC